MQLPCRKLDFDVTKSREYKNEYHLALSRGAEHPLRGKVTIPRDKLGGIVHDYHPFLEETASKSGHSSANIGHNAVSAIIRPVAD